LNNFQKNDFFIWQTKQRKHKIGKIFWANFDLEPSFMSGKHDKNAISCVLKWCNRAGFYFQTSIKKIIVSIFFFEESSGQTVKEECYASFV